MGPSLYFCAVDLFYLSDEALNTFIDRALQEDVGDGDHSSLGAFPASTQHQAQLLIKDDGILAGVDLALRIFARVDASLQVEVLIQDGSRVKYGQVALRVAGKAQSILTAERLVLNCMQRMSGIATYTDTLNQLIAGTGARLLDTRKTTPNFRICEKWAVAIGGGTNHRYGLYDMVMLKDNHIDFAGGIAKAVASVKQYLSAKGKNLRIEVETRNLDEVQQVLDCGGVDVIMLDNMHPELMREAVALIGDRCETEASGGITEKTIRAAAETGVNFISVGALTHSAMPLDLSLKAIS